MRRPNSVAGSEAALRGAVIVIVLIILLLPLAVGVAGLSTLTSLLIVSKGTLRFAALISLVTAVVLPCSLLADPRHKPDRQLN